MQRLAQCNNCCYITKYHSCNLGYNYVRTGPSSVPYSRLLFVWDITIITKYQIPQYDRHHFPVTGILLIILFLYFTIHLQSAINYTEKHLFVHRFIWLHRQFPHWSISEPNSPIHSQIRRDVAVKVNLLEEMSVLVSEINRDLHMDEYPPLNCMSVHTQIIFSQLDNVKV